MANAISTPTSTAYRRRFDFVAPVPAPDLRRSFGSVRDTPIDGNTPTTTRQKSVATSAKTSTRQLICGSTTYLPTLGGIDALSARELQYVNTRPSERPAPASKALSFRRWAIRRPRLAPSADRR